MGVAFRAKTGRSFLKSDTLGHIWIKGVYTSVAAGDGSPVHFCMGVGFFASGIDNADFPDLDSHDGDLQLHDARGLLENLLTTRSLEPPELALVDIESAGQRTVPAGGTAYELFTVLQAVEAPSQTVTFVGSFTQLWLIAG